jgi:hypothetical protein
MQENRQEKSLIKRNILKYLEFKGVSEYKFYQNTGITRGVLGQNNGISEENTTKFLAYYPEVDANWLLTGTGSMLRKQNVQNKEITQNDTVDTGINLQGKDTYNKGIEQKKDTIIEELLNRLEKQSEVIGALKQENTQLRRQLQKKSNQHYTDAADAECAAAV